MGYDFQKVLFLDEEIILRYLVYKESDDLYYTDGECKGIEDLDSQKISLLYASKSLSNGYEN